MCTCTPVTKYYIAIKGRRSWGFPENPEIREISEQEALDQKNHTPSIGRKTEIFAVKEVVVDGETYRHVGEKRMIYSG